MTNTIDEPVTVAKQYHEFCVKKVQDLQSEITSEKAKGRLASPPRLAWLQKQVVTALADIRSAKQRLRALSGTSGHDTKWLLVARSHALLTSLTERGFDIGEHGRKLVADIEFHVPLARLDAAMQALDDVEEVQ